MNLVFITVDRIRHREIFVKVKKIKYKANWTRRVIQYQTSDKITQHSNEQGETEYSSVNLTNFVIIDVG